MNHAIDKAEVTLYYNYENEKVQFRAGAFPRREVLSNYSDFFFRDSVNQFMPLMQGIFWQLGKENNFVNAWMDWTGYSTAEKRESFFLGLSGKTSKGLFFADFQSSLFHLAGNYPNDGRFGVSEVIQGIASVGLEYSFGNHFRMMTSAGIFAAVERDRRQMKPIDRLVYRSIQCRIYGCRYREHALCWRPSYATFREIWRQLYWGNPYLQGSRYLQSKWYIRLIDSERTKLRLNCNMHFSEGALLFQQALALTVTVGTLRPQQQNSREYPWMRFFQ